MAQDMVLTYITLKGLMSLGLYGNGKIYLFVSKIVLK